MNDNTSVPHRIILRSTTDPIVGGIVAGGLVIPGFNVTLSFFFERIILAKKKSSIGVVFFLSL